MFPYLTLYFRYSFGKLDFVGLWQLWIHTDTLALLPTFLIFVLEMKTKTWHQTLVSCLSADITPTKTKQTCRWAESEGFPTGSTTKLIWTVFILLWDELSNWRQQFHRDGNDIRITFSSLPANAHSWTQTQSFSPLLHILYMTCCIQTVSEILRLFSLEMSELLNQQLRYCKQKSQQTAGISVTFLVLKSRTPWHSCRCYFDVNVTSAKCKPGL